MNKPQIQTFLNIKIFYYILYTIMFYYMNIMLYYKNITAY